MGKGIKMAKGFFQMGSSATKAARKDPNYIAAFDWARDMDYTVGSARAIADDVARLMSEDSNLGLCAAIRKALE